MVLSFKDVIHFNDGHISLEIDLKPEIKTVLTALMELRTHVGIIFDFTEQATSSKSEINSFANDNEVRIY